MDVQDQLSARARSTNSELPNVHHGRLLTRKDKIREAPYIMGELDQNPKAEPSPGRLRAQLPHTRPHDPGCNRIAFSLKMPSG